MKYLNARFSLFNSSFYLIYGIIYGYAALYMEAKGFSGTEVGIAFSVSSVICILLQSFLGSFLDRHLQFSARDVIFVFSLILIAAVTVLRFTASGSVIMLCFVVILSLLLVDSSLFNTFGMEFINEGYDLNYSRSRGLGALAYSFAVLIMGFIIERNSENAIIPAFFMVQAVIMITMFMVRPVKRSSSFNNPSGTDSIIGLLRKRPELFMLLCGMLLMYLSYTAISNFHINIIESVGGGSRELGISAFIAAFIEVPVMVAFISISRRFSYESLLRFSGLFFVVRAVLMTFVSSVAAVYAVQSLQFLSYGLFIPSSTYYINSILDSADMAKGQTLLGIFTFGLSGFISSLMSGTVLDHFGVHTLLVIISLLTAAGFIIVIIALRWIRSK